MSSSVRGHLAARGQRVGPEPAHQWYPVPAHELGQATPVRERHRVRQSQSSPGSLSHKRLERDVELLERADLEHLEGHAKPSVLVAEPF